MQTTVPTYDELIPLLDQLAEVDDCGLTWNQLAAYAKRRRRERKAAAQAARARLAAEERAARERPFRTPTPDERCYLVDHRNDPPEALAAHLGLDLSVVRRILEEDARSWKRPAYLGD